MSSGVTSLGLKRLIAKSRCSQALSQGPRRSRPGARRGVARRCGGRGTTCSRSRGRSTCSAFAADDLGAGRSYSETQRGAVENACSTRRSGMRARSPSTGAPAARSSFSASGSWIGAPVLEHAQRGGVQSDTAGRQGGRGRVRRRVGGRHGVSLAADVRVLWRHCTKTRRTQAPALESQRRESSGGEVVETKWSSGRLASGRRTGGAHGTQCHAWRCSRISADQPCVLSRLVHSSQMGGLGLSRGSCGTLTRLCSPGHAWPREGSAGRFNDRGCGVWNDGTDTSSCTTPRRQHSRRGRHDAGHKGRRRAARLLILAQGRRCWCCGRRLAAVRRPAIPRAQLRPDLSQVGWSGL